ncbi:MAG: dephospho-CoA kinase, partial [Candidatus Eremiobacteraeota bacterium]|nr:dephospho-CoA kinase [Candidatus Eremiobacteraeota bacterium]
MRRSSTWPTFRPKRSKRSPRTKKPTKRPTKSPKPKEVPKLRVGLTGGLGAGKSEVAKIFESLGVYIIETDELARAAVAPNSDGLRAIARAWPQVVQGDSLNRAALAEIVFRNETARERLNAIVHPFVRQLAIEKEENARPGQLIVHVVPLLFETDYAGRCDATVVVIAPDELRVRRVLERDKWTEDQIRARMSAQMDPEEAR